MTKPKFLDELQQCRKEVYDLMNEVNKLKKEKEGMKEAIYWIIESTANDIKNTRIQLKEKDATIDLFEWNDVTKKNQEALKKGDAK